MPGTRPDAKTAKCLVTCEITLMRFNEPKRADMGKHGLTIDGVKTALVAAATAALTAVPAHADPDPHIPNMGAGYCPGGGMGSQIWLAYCDGIPYPDGSFWHAIQYGIPVIGRPYGALSPGLQCVVPNGAVPAPAPPGACGGAWQG